MPGDQFEFDESGDTFFCFLAAFYTLILIPLTYFYWPTFDPRDSYEPGKRKCICQPCQLKRHYLKTSTPFKRLKKILIKGMFVFAWGVFFLLLYKLTLIEAVSSEFDPFAELGIEKDASVKDIRQAYKKLSLQFHPDKGGDPKKFIRISKAYATLTDEQSRKNWEEFGNPDGPGATHFGIALPKWMIQKENFYLVIGAYALLFMIILPVSVGVWWYNTVKFNNNRILLDTSRYFCGAFYRSPYMSMPRVIKVLSNALEFNPHFNKEFKCRPSDNVELPPLIMQIPIFTIFKKAIVGSPYSVKTRALIYAHLERLELPPNTLHLDRQYIVKHAPRLIDEMINSLHCVLVVTMEEGSSRHKNPQFLATMENCMHLIPLLVQALSDNASPLLQLPHITQTQLRQMATKHRNIKSIRQFLALPDDKRRNLLRSLSDEQYRDILVVCSSMPVLEISYRCEVCDEDDPSIWPLSMVTTTVELKRHPLLNPDAINNATSTAAATGLADVHYADGGQSMHLDWTAYNQSLNSELYPAAEKTLEAQPLSFEDFAVDEKKSDQNRTQSKKSTPAVWDKSKRRKPKGKNKSRKQQQQQQQQQPAQQQQQPQQPAQTRSSSGLVGCSESEPEELDFPNDTLYNHMDNGPTNPTEPTDSPEHDDLDDPNSTGDLPDSTEHSKTKSAVKSIGQSNQSKSSSETKPRCTHLVHCPYFPVEKFEGWWVYLVDRKTRQLITRPVYVATLQTQEEIQLRFVAPVIPGQYLYILCVRSDSYLDSDFSESVRFTVRPPPMRTVRFLRTPGEGDSDGSACSSCDSDSNEDETEDDDGDDDGESEISDTAQKRTQLNTSPSNEPASNDDEDEEEEDEQTRMMDQSDEDDEPSSNDRLVQKRLADYLFKA